MTGTETGPSTGPIDALAAMDRAHRLVPGAVIALERRRRRGIDVWEAGVLRADGTASRLSLNMADGVLVRKRPMHLSPAQRTPAPGVTAEQAIATVRIAVPDPVTGLGLQYEGSVRRWRIEVAMDHGGHRVIALDAEVEEPG